jgi:RsiW-degrading membrane proteinase PrsW (M82 family)
MLNRIELILGTLASLTGLIGWSYALFAPTYSSSEGARASVAQVSLNAVSVTFFIVMLLAIVGLGASTYQHGVRHRRGSLAPLWISVGILFIGTILSGFSVGLFFLPGTILSLCTGIVASLGDAQTHR